MYTECTYPQCENCGYIDCLVEHPNKIISRREKALENPEASRQEKDRYNARRREIRKINRDIRERNKSEDMASIERKKEVKKICNDRYLEKVKTDNELSEKKRQYQRDWNARNKERISEYNRKDYQKRKMAAAQ